MIHKRIGRTLFQENKLSYRYSNFFWLPRQWLWWGPARQWRNCSL